METPMKATSESTSVPNDHKKDLGVDLHGANWYPTPRMVRIGSARSPFQLLAQVADVHVERALVRRGARWYSTAASSIARYRAAGGAHQHFEDVEFD